MEVKLFITLAFSFISVTMATSTAFFTTQYLLPFSYRSVATMTHYVSIHQSFSTRQCSKKWSRHHATAFACPATFLSGGAARYFTGTLKAVAGEIKESSDKINKDLKVKHWFTLTLPEGTCVGITSTDQNQPKTNCSTPLSVSLLHDDEYAWGMQNVASDVSRNSFYLGRVALRSSFKEMLKTGSDGSQQIDNGTNDEMLLWKQIQLNPIRKDDFGRPILPDVVVGSISHKGEYAVGLSRLRMDNSSCFALNGDEMKSMDLTWRQECPVNVDEEEYGDAATSNDATLFDESSVVGVGVDLERIDDERGPRIQRKILTEREQQDLGRLEVSTPFAHCSLVFNTKRCLIPHTVNWHIKRGRSNTAFQVSLPSYDCC